MNKLAFYILFILIYLGISKSFSPEERALPYIVDNRVLGHYFEGSPLELILDDYFEAGFLIKTYFHKYRVVRGPHSMEIILARVSKKFYETNQDYLGMSIFRRSEKTGKESVLVAPGGTLFIGDLAYGTWENSHEDSDNHEKFWRFHNPYKSFVEFFKWKDFRPSQTFFKRFNLYSSENRVFYGTLFEYGRNGSISGQFYEEHFKKNLQLNRETIKSLLYKSFSLPNP